jgi:poly-gamma-glutamate synthesis protein (capsule biosynthesis protein)
MRKRSVIALALFLLLLIPAKSFAAPSSFSIAAVGDVNFSGKLQLIGDSNGYDYFFAKTSEFISSADLSILNLETSVSDRGSPVPNKEFTFRSRPKALQAVRRAGFDAVSIANNHSLDFGKTAFLDTIANLKKAGISFAGGGENIDDALKPAELKTYRSKVAFLAFSDVVPAGFAAGMNTPGTASIKSISPAIDAVRKADRDFDFVVVSIHWGIEMSYAPSNRQIDLARKLIDAGADAVFGHHPHVVQPVEIYKGRPIFYSLGNFVFSPGAEAGSYSMIARVVMGRSGVLSIEAVPVRILKGQPVPYRDRWASSLRKIISSRSVDFEEESGILVYRRFKDLSFIYHLERFEGEYF